MIEFIIPISFVILLLFIPIYYIFIKTKKDERDYSKIKAVANQTASASKRTKKKTLKKGLQNESEVGNSMDENIAENAENGSLARNDKKEIHETGTDEAVLPSKKRKSKGKTSSGDQFSTETKTPEIEKNDNQSNTLIGRHGEGKLKEEILCLEKKLDDSEREKLKNETSLKEITTLIQKKESENETLKVNLSHATSQLKKLQSDLDSEKDRSSKAIESIKAQSAQDNGGHVEMYRKYENIIEQLKNEISKYKNESVNLNKNLKEELLKREDIKKQYEEVKANLTSKNEELKKSHGSCQTLQENNAILKKTVEELQLSWNVKEKDLLSARKVAEAENARCQTVLDKLNKDIEDKVKEVENIKKTEANYLCQIANLNDEVKQWNVIVENEKIKSKKLLSDMDESNTRLEVELHKLEKELKQKNRIIEDLEAKQRNTNELAKDIDNKTFLIDELTTNEEKFRAEISRLNEIIEGLKNGYEMHEKELFQKHNELPDKINQLQEVISSLEKDIENKIFNESVLKQEIISLNKSVEELKKSETLSNQLININAGLNADICNLNEVEQLRKSGTEELSDKNFQEDLIKELQKEIELLRNKIQMLNDGIHKKDEKLEQLLQNSMTLVNENNLLEQALSEKSEELLNDNVVPERNIQLMSECPSNVLVDSDEIDKLKSHIKKLEKELLGMQGRYYMLKEDSIKTEVGDKHLNRIVKSESSVVSIAPNDDENYSQNQKLPAVDNRSSAHDSLQEAICRLNSEIEEQRITNQELKQSYSLSQSEKSSITCQHEALAKDHKLLKERYVELEKQFSSINKAAHDATNVDDEEMTEKINTLRDENNHLKIQLEKYRVSLEKTEQMLEKIQFAVSNEETNWRTSLRSSEQDCNLLEIKVKELSNEIEVLKSTRATASNEMIASVVSIDNGFVSDNKKKRKRKNKKKKSTGVSESNGD